MNRLKRWLCILPLGFFITLSRLFCSTEFYAHRKVFWDPEIDGYRDTKIVGVSRKNPNQSHTLEFSASRPKPKNSPKNKIINFQKGINKLENGLISVSDLKLYVNRSTGKCKMHFGSLNQASLYKLETKETFFYFKLTLLSSKQPDKLKNDNPFRSPYLVIFPDTLSGYKVISFDSKKRKDLLLLFDDCKVDLLVLKDGEEPPKRSNLERITSDGHSIVKHYFLWNRSLRNFIQNRQQSLAHLLVLLPILSSCAMIWYVVKRSSCFQKEEPQKTKKKKRPIPKRKKPL